MPILVVAEQLRGELSDITFEMLGVGRELADALGEPLHAVIAGEEVSGLAARLGKADTVYLLEDPALAMPDAADLAGRLKALLEQSGTGLVLVAGTNVSAGIGPYLAKQTGLPSVNFGHQLKAEGGAVVVTSRLFGAKILSDVRLVGARGIVSVYPGSYPVEAGQSDQAPAVESVSLPGQSAVKFVDYLEPEAADVDITRFDLLIAVGRGIESEDNVKEAEELAKLLDGALCASRPVIDQGWLPMTRQVGKSGMSVKPRVYIAFGISGAPEHWEGMQASETIIAVNTDETAPIFDNATYGTTEDALDVLPALLEKVQEKKG